MSPTPSRKDRTARRFFRQFEPLRKRLVERLEGANERERSRQATALLHRLLVAQFLQGRDVRPEQLGLSEAGISFPEGERERWRAFLGSWRWTPDEDAPASDGQLDPGLLGYLLERSVNRRELGAYYTGQDVTGYICRNILIPRLFDLCAGAGREDAVSRFLSRAELERYVYEAVKTAERLPAESDSEYAARQERFTSLLRDFEAGKIRALDDGITYNLDLEALAGDFIRSIEEPGLLWSLYDEGLRRLTVLDPAVGSGAFLLAALRLLRPLYLAALRRMGELETEHAELRRIRKEYPSFEYYAIATILSHNLFGVDLAEEAVEVCRLRLLLRLVASGDGPLPDLSRHLRVGNSLTGVLRPERGTPPQDFHWFAEFPEHLAAGGFDAIIGNPPYVESSQVRGEYEIPAEQYSARYANLYAYFLERSHRLLREGARLGMIVPVSCVSGTGYRPVLDRLRTGSVWLSTFSNRPGKLFDGVEQRLAIVLAHASGPAVTRCTSYQHWCAGERPAVFSRLQYVEASIWEGSGMPVKSGSPVAERVFAKLTRHQGRLPFDPEGEHRVWVHDGPTYWVRALPFEPNPGQGETRSHHYHALRFGLPDDALLAAAVLCSTTFYFFFKLVSNCRDLSRREWCGFPIDPLSPPLRERLRDLGAQLRDRLQHTAAERTRVYPSGTVTYREYYPAQAREVLDQIDAVLAEHYALDPDEAQYVREYELKYRLGQDAG